jgi:hypothetical protein
VICWLKRLFRREPIHLDGVIYVDTTDEALAAMGPRPCATDWDVAEAAMRAQTDLQQRGIDYRFLGVTGEEAI